MRGICQRCHRITDLQEHHIARRSNDPDNTVMICFDCHRWIHENPSQAKAEGLYTPLDSKFRKKYSKKSKWRINLGVKTNAPKKKKSS